MNPRLSNVIDSTLASWSWWHVSCFVCDESPLLSVSLSDGSIDRVLNVIMGLVLSVFIWWVGGVLEYITPPYKHRAVLVPT